jgi:hypothetical protein
MATRNWHIRKEDSEITFIDTLLTGPDIETKVESDIKNLLSSLGIEAKKITKKDMRTPDYGSADIFIEVTTVHPYFLLNNEMSKIISELEINLGNCYHVYYFYHLVVH